MRNNNNFKILGVRLLDGCGKHIVKNLQIGHFYSFYQNFKFDEEKNFVTEFEKTIIPQDFFLPNVNIHAIVGKNGSGKSTIVEVIIRIINNLAYSIIGPANQYAAENLVHVKNLNAELYFISNELIFKIKCDKATGSASLCDSKGDAYPIEKSLLEKLFFTNIVNYSHYAYNSEDYKKEIIGRYKTNSWIRSLFHKNDGYTTPIVLNPYRDKGNIDINSETDLASQRLISLFLYFALQKKSFHNDYEIQSFRLKYDKDKINQKYKDANDKYFPHLFGMNKVSFDEVKSIIIDAWKRCINIITLNDIEEQYFVYKTLSIIAKYDYFKNFFENKVKLKGYNIGLQDTIFFINDDTSHITLKVRQLIKYLLLNRNYAEGPITQNQILDKFANFNIGYNLDQIAVEDILVLLPPPIFKTSFYLQYRDKKKSRANILLTSLSSGERQMLFSISSVLYHLENLNTIKSEGRIKYDNYQIILEEIELYYHPEYQRKFISQLLGYIKMLNIAKDKCIDIMIVTHSPFTLSDIPKQNILFLDNGEQQFMQNTKDTFCANYYDLLRYSFFLEDNAIGAFAEGKLSQIRDLMNGDLHSKDDILPIISLIGDKFIKNYFLSKVESK